MRYNLGVYPQLKVETLSFVVHSVTHFVNPKAIRLLYIYHLLRDY